jgi:hypothetical protein
MKKGSKPGARRMTRATRSREKQSISGQRQQREKEGARAETGAGVPNIAVSQSSHKKAAITRGDWLKDECDFQGINSSEIVTCYYYEYFRESAAMREAFKEGHPMPLTGDAWDSIRLRSALTMAGFPVAWNKLEVDRKKELTKVVLAWRASDTDTLKHPPLVVSELPLGCYYDLNVQDEELKRWWEKAYVPASFSEAESYPVDDRHSYFFGLFRLDETYNEGEAVAAFRKWYANKYVKLNRGGSHASKSKLNALVALRIRHHEGDRTRRFELLRKFTGMESYGTKDHKVLATDAIRDVAASGSPDAVRLLKFVKQMVHPPESTPTDTADTVLHRSCNSAVAFFKALFPSEMPLSAAPLRGGKS